MKRLHYNVSMIRSLLLMFLAASYLKAEPRRIKIFCMGTMSNSGATGRAYIGRYDNKESFALALSDPEHDGGWLTDIIVDKIYDYHSRELLSNAQEDAGDSFWLRDVVVDLRTSSGRVWDIKYVYNEDDEMQEISRKEYAILNSCVRRAH